MKLISVEVNDPDHEPFVAHLPMTWPNDYPADLREQTRALTAAQLREAAGRELDEAGRARARQAGSCRRSCTTWRWCTACSLISAASCRPRPTTARFSTRAAACSLAFGLPGGGRVTMTHLNLPGVPDYTERVTVFCADRIIELTFPSPYLRHLPDAAHGAAGRRRPRARTVR